MAGNEGNQAQDYRLGRCDGCGMEVGNEPGLVNSWEEVKEG